MFSAKRTAVIRELDPITRSYDFDGVVSLGIMPAGDRSIIVTGRTMEEANYVVDVIHEMGDNPLVPILFNPTPKSIRERWHSAVHKASVLLAIPRHFDIENGTRHYHFDDDLLQIEVMREVIEKTSTGEIYDLPNSVWTRLIFDGVKPGHCGPGLVEYGARPEDIFLDYQAQFLVENLHYVHVNCPWVEK